MSDIDLERVIEKYHAALHAFVSGDPEPQKKLFSHRDDVTLANPFGPPALGWAEVETTLDRAASLLRDGEGVDFQRISAHVTADLGYILEIERARAKVGGSEDVAPIALRVTTIFRLEESGWRIVHRHADPITTPRGVESIL